MQNRPTSFYSSISAKKLEFFIDSTFGTTLLKVQELTYFKGMIHSD